MLSRTLTARRPVAPRSARVPRSRVAALEAVVARLAFEVSDLRHELALARRALEHERASGYLVAKELERFRAEREAA